LANINATWVNGSRLWPPDSFGDRLDLAVIEREQGQQTIGFAEILASHDDCFRSINTISR
jgi:hypothetical protein